VALFKAGKSKAEVWDALVAEGVERNAATALVTEVGKLKEEADASARAAAPPPAPLGPSPYAPYGAYQGTDRTKVITGLVLFTLGFVVSVGTCSEASKSGGHYVMMWGPMAAGIVLILRGLGVQGR
jgi:hypothetical protein